MCKVRIVHFSQHDVRRPMATQLFSDDDGASGGFFMSGLVGGCDCGANVRDRFKLPEDDNNNNGSVLPFQPCFWHRCCVVSPPQVTPCRWYWDNRVALRLDEHPEPEYLCDNCHITSEYYPLSMVVEEEGANGVDEWDGKPADLRPYPTDFLYSREVFWGADPGQEGLALGDDRAKVSESGGRLWEEKEKLKQALAEASRSVERLERSLSGKAGLQGFVQNPLVGLYMMHVAKRRVRHALCREWKAAFLFREMMKYTGFVLLALNRMPEEGESAASADGSYSVSREQLDLAQLEPCCVVEACEGPLKQAGRLQERLAELRDILRVPKILKRRRRGRARDSPRPVKMAKD